MSPGTLVSYLKHSLKKRYKPEQRMLCVYAPWTYLPATCNRCENERCCTYVYMSNTSYQYMLICAVHVNNWCSTHVHTSSIPRWYLHLIGNWQVLCVCVLSFSQFEFSMENSPGKTSSYSHSVQFLHQFLIVLEFPQNFSPEKGNFVEGLFISFSSSSKSSLNYIPVLVFFVLF